ncbi:NAD-dependent epimerase/dehydratase family protein [Leifsonia sp. Leaf264]|uniref:NAD-dependent epimerase/dehydratase family protein n=1 Tax=Leifsonia sp. Leaf264 TaxID=1736314 RepID=UPI0006F64157|nr:NAD-dependent epimerase/dehydratase family protein [Leifsonia sp. Leaf264]KQO99431.1 nucleoside-diphosphate sugar epimerase [Leifsonia sp. Leaf264]
MTRHVWVVGARGLLGRGVVERLRARPGWSVADARPLPWSDPAAFAAAVASTLDGLAAAVAAGPEGDEWAVVWAAGAAVTNSPREALDAELHQLDVALRELESAGSRGLDPRSGALFYASSAGGVYGGSEHPPFDENTPPRPLAPYGHFKLEAEELVRGFGERSGVPVLIGRIANLYGPGQSLDKMQGLISHLARAQLTPQPASIYVSLDTLRDYIFVLDCADLVIDCVARLATTPGVTTKIIASGQSVTIADLLGYFRLISKGKPHAMLGSNAASALQAHDLRVRSVVWPDLDVRSLMPLPAGIHATIEDLKLGMQAAR